MTAYNSDIWKEVPGRNVYSVPEMYFTTLPDQIMSRIYEGQTLQIPQQAPYQVPSGYFETLSSRILSQVLQGASQPSVAGNENVYQELQRIAPLLNTISKNNVYSVPAGYFNQHAAAAVAAVVPAQAKVVPLVSRIQKWVSYSTAAALAAIMVTAAFMFNDNNNVNSGANSSYTKNSSTLDVKKEVSVLSEDEIVSYLSTHPSGTDISTTAVGSVTPDIQHIVKDISEEEIRQYLKENSEPGEGSAKGI